MEVPVTLRHHHQHRGKIEIISKVPLETKEDLSTYYTPGVAEPCRAIAKNPEDVYRYSSKGNMVAVVTDGSAVLGLGNIGPEAALPVMEGKAILFKKFADLDAFPICLRTQDSEEIIRIIQALEPSFGGINLEDISAPRCFEIEERLQKSLTIPVFHDDQHGTAVVVLAGLINSLSIVEKKISDIKIVISGSGAAGTAITKLLMRAGANNIVVCDSRGAISSSRDDLRDWKKYFLSGNTHDEGGSLSDVTVGADLFIGVSAPNLLHARDISMMAAKAIVFAMSNPDPEIMPEEARKGGASIIATGRSDYPNQLNNVLVFPGMLKGAMKIRKQISDEMKISAAKALAGMVRHPSPEKIIPGPFEEGIAETIAKAVEMA